MVIDLRAADSVDEVLEQVRANTAGTVFENEEVVFKKHEDYVRFLLENDVSDRLSGIGYVNKLPLFLSLESHSEDLTGEKEELLDELSSSDGLDYRDVVLFSRDLLKFRKNCLVEKYVNRPGPEEVVGDYFDGSEEAFDAFIHDLATVFALEDEEVREYFEARKEEMDTVVEGLEEFLNQGTDVEYELPDEFYTDEFKEYLYVTNTTQLLDFQVESEEAKLDRYEYRQFDEPSVGEYGVLYVPPRERDDVLYRVVIRFTDAVEGEEDGVPVTEYEYEVLRYPDELLESYPKHWAVKLDQRISPTVNDELQVTEREPGDEMELVVAADEVAVN